MATMLMGVLIGIVVLGIVLVVLGQRGSSLPWVPGRQKRQAQLDRDVNRGIEARDTAPDRGIDGAGFPGQ
jgi:hypothetical protein